MEPKSPMAPSSDPLPSMKPDTGQAGAGEPEPSRAPGPHPMALLLGGWLAIALVAGILHLLLGAFGVIDLCGLLAAGGWSVVIVFAWMDDRFKRAGTLKQP